MPGGAPPPVQFAPLSFASPSSTNIGDQMRSLGKNLTSARKAFTPPEGPAVDPGTAIQGGQGPIVAGGPQGPAPLPGQQALPGSPYSPQAGPVAPPQAAMPQVQPQAGMAPQQPDVSQSPAIMNMVRNTPPPMLLDWLKRTAGLGPLQPSLPGGPNIAQTPGLGMLGTAQGYLGGQ